MFAIGKPIEVVEFAEHTSVADPGSGHVVGNRSFSPDLEWTAERSRPSGCTGPKVRKKCGVGFRAERGSQAIVALECPTPTVLSLINWEFASGAHHPAFNASWPDGNFTCLYVRVWPKRYTNTFPV